VVEDAQSEGSEEELQEREFMGRGEEVGGGRAGRSRGRDCTIRSIFRRPGRRGKGELQRATCGLIEVRVDSGRDSG